MLRCNPTVRSQQIFLFFEAILREFFYFLKVLDLDSDMSNSLLYSIMLSKKQTKSDKMIFIRSYLETNFGPLHFASTYDLFKNLQSTNNLDMYTIGVLCENLPSNYTDFIPFIIYLMHLEDDLNNHANSKRGRYDHILHDHCY